MTENKKTILAISSGGGHWVQLLRLRLAFEGHQVVFATTRPGYQSDVADAEFRVVPDCNRWEKLKLVKCCLRILWLILSLRPNVVISTGAAPGYFAIRLGRMFGAKTIWVDSIANAEELSMSGQKVGRHAHLWLTQWEHLSQELNGPLFHGNVLSDDVENEDAMQGGPNPAEADSLRASGSNENSHIFVTVGTDLPFDRLIKAVDDWARKSSRSNVFAQIGNAEYEPTHIAYSRFLEPPQFQEKFKQAELVISHAGMGTILSSLLLQKSLLVMPRIAAKGEHRNEHQLATVKHLAKLNRINIAGDEVELCQLLDRKGSLPLKSKIGRYASSRLIAALRECINS